MSRARVAVLEVITKELSTPRHTSTHLGVGYAHAHARTRVLAIADDTDVTVIALETGAVLSTHHIDPTRSYWRNTQEDPGRWPGPS